VQQSTVNAYIVKLETTGLVEGEGSVGNNQVPSTVNKNVNNKTKKKNKNKNKKNKNKKDKREVVNAFNNNSLKSATSCILKINGNETECLIDSGANTSFISEKFWKQRNFSKEKLKTRKNWVTANGNPISIEGQTQLHLEIGSKGIKADFVIAKDLAHKVIIGVDILKPNGCIVNFGDNKLTCGDQ